MTRKLTAAIVKTTANMTSNNSSNTYVIKSRGRMNALFPSFGYRLSRVVLREDNGTDRIVVIS